MQPEVTIADSRTSTFNLDFEGNFIRISFVSLNIPQYNTPKTNLQVSKVNDEELLIVQEYASVFLNYTLCLNITAASVDEFIDKIVEASQKEEIKQHPLGMGIEARIRFDTSQEHERPSSIYMESNYVNTVERSVGMPRGSNADIFTFKLTPGQLQISSSSADDTDQGIGAEEVVIIGLKKVAGVWSDVEARVTLDGHTPVAFGDATWWRINKIFVSSTGTSNKNQGDIYITDLGAATTNGVPDVGVDVRGAMLAGFSNSTMGIFSVKTGYRFLYTKGNIYTIANALNPAVIHETGWYNYDGITNGKLTQYNVGFLGAGGPVSYNYDGSAPYFQESDLDFRAYTISGILESLVYYNEYVLVPNESFSGV